MPSIDYSQYTAQAQAAGAKAGKAQAELEKQRRAQERKLRLEQRYAQLAKDKQRHENELAKTEYMENIKAQALEAEDFRGAYENGWIDQDDMYQRKYFEDMAKEERRKTGIKFTALEEQTWLNSEDGLKAAADRLQSGHAKYMNRTYKKGAAETYLREQLSYNDRQAKREMDQPVYSEGMEGAGEKLGDALISKVFGEGEPDKRPTMESGPAPRMDTFEEMEVSDRIDLGARGSVQPIDRSSLQKVQIQGQAGVFFHDPKTNQVMGPSTNGQWVDAGSVQMLPQERKPITLDYTDMHTKQEMTGTLIETFPGDEAAVLVQGGKTYAPMGTPTMKHGSQDQHDPTKLTKAQNADLVARDSSTNVLSLATEVLNDEFQSNPASWLAARMSSVSDMFVATIPGLRGTVEDLDTIVAYVRDNTDKEAASKLGVLDAAAIREGDHEATTKLLSYATALWMNGGTRITVKVSEDAEAISESWLSGTAAHRGKLVSLTKQASGRYARAAARHLSTSVDDDIWNQYPTAKRKVQQGWELALDKADGYSLKGELERLKKEDPEAYARSVASLESTLASQDTLTEPVFWSNKYNTMVAIYHKTDPKTGAIRFATFKLE